jgi:hypothetical protein
MSSPNIVNVTTIYGNTAVSAITTVTSNILTNSANSNSVIKLNNIIIANYTSNNIGTTVILNRSSSSHYLAGNITVPANSTLVVLGKDTGIYMLEGDIIQASATANTSASFIASYEVIS